ncbi:MAG: hypothetical protein Q4B96_06970 [Bacillota bacterium]|nr:hypothetical protein [Bacillota bacterium]
MRAEREIISKLEQLKRRLAIAVEEKTLYDDQRCPAVDMLIYTLIDKIEALGWVLEQPLPPGDILECRDEIAH